ncbi:hypothetical protein LWI28_012689 [Acer negundo]|uniref:LysM domain-containing protein n=1 Tax=Acer negundo TaxID=4023 RepID=A0AAD5IZ51_ACENE|nr:hypothetical protein LWI28_012689 [Acer negundo]
MGCVNQVLIFILLSLSALFFSSSTAQNFKCNAPGMCSTLVGYAPHNITSLSDILKLFNIKNLRNVLGANNLPLTTLRNYTVEAKKTIKIPISCRCSNGTGVSYNGPVYTVKKDDELFLIASEVFSGLVVYQKIQEANKISNANLIKIGQNLTIPLPCSCDDVDGDKVVHYAHLVQSGSTLESIAKEFGTDEATLKKINDIADDSKLIADQPIDVPLKACNSSIKSESPDNGLRAANGTYVFTANNYYNVNILNLNLRIPSGKHARLCNVKVQNLYPSATPLRTVAIRQPVPMLVIQTKPSLQQPLTHGLVQILLTSLQGSVQVGASYSSHQFI